MSVQLLRQYVRDTIHSTEKKLVCILYGVSTQFQISVNHDKELKALQYDEYEMSSGSNLYFLWKSFNDLQISNQDQNDKDLI